MEGPAMISRLALVTSAASALLLAVTPVVAIDTQDPADVQIFTDAMCVTKVTADAKILSLQVPNTENPNAAVAVAFKTLPDVKEGDLVKLTPHPGGTQPDVKVVEKAAKSCKRFLP